MISVFVGRLILVLPTSLLSYDLIYHTMPYPLRRDPMNLFHKIISVENDVEKSSENLLNTEYRR